MIPRRRAHLTEIIYMRSINRNIMNSVEKIVAISSDTKNRAIQFYNIQKDIQVINYGFTPIKRHETNQNSFNQKTENFISSQSEGL